MTTNGLIHDGLAYWARLRPDHPAFVLDGGDRLTYRETLGWADGIAEHLREIGIGPGDVVALAAANALAWIPAAFAILRVGAIITPFNDRLLGEDLAWQAGHSGARLVIADTKRAQLLDAAEVGVPIVPLNSLEAFSWPLGSVPRSSRGFRRSGDDHLHQWQHCPAQGRDHGARQLPGQVSGDASACAGAWP